MALWLALLLCGVAFILGTILTRWVVVTQFKKQLHDPNSGIRTLIDGKHEDTTEHYAHMAQLYQDSVSCENQCGAEIAEGMRKSEATVRALGDPSQS